MKRIVLLASIALLAFAAPALACGKMNGKAGSAGNMKNVESEIVRTDTGVKVVLTSTDAETVKALQAKAKTFLAGECEKSCPMKADGAEHEVTNIKNGVVIKASTDNPEQAKKMQEYAEKRLKGGAFLGGDCPMTKGKKGKVASAS